MGIALGSFGSVGINLGNNLQSLGLTLLAAEMSEHLQKLEQEGYSIHDPKETLPNPKFMSKGRITFIVGTATFATSSIINFVAFAFAPASILAPLEAIQVCCQLFMGRIIHKKPITLLAAASTAVTCFGVTAAVAAVPPMVYEFTVPQLTDLWNSGTWIAFLIAVLSLSAVMQIIHQIWLAAEKRGKPRWRSSAITPITYSVSAAIIGALSVAQAKALSELVTLLFPPCIINIFTEPFFYMTLFLLAGAGGVWLNRSVAALALYDPNFIIPLLQSNYIVWATISGGVFFQEFAAMSSDPWRWPLFAGGLLVMLIGLYGLFVAGSRSQDLATLEAKAVNAAPATPAAASAGSSHMINLQLDLPSVTVALEPEEQEEAAAADPTPPKYYTPNYNSADATGGPPSAAAAVKSPTSGSSNPGRVSFACKANPNSAERSSSIHARSPSSGSNPGRVSFACKANPNSAERSSSSKPRPADLDAGPRTPDRASRTPPDGAMRSGTGSRGSTRGSAYYKEALPSVQKFTPTGSLAEVFAQSRDSRRLLQTAVGGGAQFEPRGSVFVRPSATPPRPARGGSALDSTRSSWYRESSGASRRGSDDAASGGALAVAAANPPSPVRRGSTLDNMTAAAARAVVDGERMSRVRFSPAAAESNGAPATTPTQESADRV